MTRRISLLLIILLLGFSLSCGNNSLRSLASKNKLYFGTAVKPGDVTDPAAVKIVKSDFNIIVPENTMKWQNIRPSKDFWNWGEVDALVAFAKKYKLALRWHTFVWHDQNPGYVLTIKKKDDMQALLKDQITTIMSRYKGTIAEYDVANEVLNEDGTLRESFWYKVFGQDYIDFAFQTARAADPNAKLFINDYSNEYAGTPKGDGFYEMVKGMVERKIPIDGVGFQLHMTADNPINEEALRANVQRFAALGLSVSFTEVDIRIAAPLSPEKLQIQADSYRTLLDVALTEPNVRTFIVWGYSDKTSWIPRVFPGYGDAHLYDFAMKAKPAYEAIKLRLQEGAKNPVKKK